MGYDGAVALARPAGFDDLDEASRARRHGADPVGEHRRFVERVGDEQYRRAGGPPQPQHFIAHQQPGLRVECAERLVEQNEPWLQHQCPCDADPLAHAAGQLRRIGARKILQSDEGESVVDAAAHLGFADAVTAQSECGVVPHRQPRKARILLEYDADAFGDFAVHRLAFECHRSRRRPLQAGKHVEESRLATARRADDGEELAFAKLQIDRTQRLDRRLVAGAGIDARDRGQLGVDIPRNGDGRSFHFCKSLGRNEVSIILLRSTSWSSMPTYFMARTVVSRSGISIRPSL